MSEQLNINKLTSAHFIGIGGAGMSGIAYVLSERGCKVTGSDLKSSHYVRELEDAGIEVIIGHEASTIDRLNPDVVVISTAIPETNPELVRARELGIDIWPRAKMLSALSEGALTIAIAGTHGKTTTSSMVATMLDKAGLDPSFLIGGIVEGYDTNARNGSGPFVAEADESDGSFLYLNPNIVVVTNIEADHLDHYGTLENIEKTFCQFMDSAGKDGTVIVCAENPHVVELARSCVPRVITYGFGMDVDYRAEHISTQGIRTALTVRCPNNRIAAVSIQANPGMHNVLNACAALAVGDVLGLDLAVAQDALSEFKGARRRFTHVGDVAGITVVDDYAHHPTEISSTLEAASQLDYKRIICVFQPHRYSRTQALAKEFAHAFDHADTLFVMDVFSAGEMPIPGVSGKTVASSVRAAGVCKNVYYVANRTALIEHLCDVCQEDDILFTMGAGDVTLMGPQFIDAMNERLAQ